MIGDGGVRGATLETCLAKMLYCSGRIVRPHFCVNCLCVCVCVCVCGWVGVWVCGCGGGEEEGEERSGERKTGGLSNNLQI